MTSHVVLVGDSVFDNKAYTKGDPDVAAHLRSVMPAWKVTLCAIDGTTTQDIGRQFQRVPDGAEHVVMSVGGNDALMNADLLDLPVRSTAQALELFRERLDVFETSYGWAIDALIALERRPLVCTIYNGNLGAESQGATMALMMFNDVILRAALTRGVDVLELRLVCRDNADFANPIEPSGTGGEKIAKAIAGALGVCAPTHRVSISA